MMPLRRNNLALGFDLVDKRSARHKGRYEMTRTSLAVALTAMIAASGASAASLQSAQGEHAPVGSESTRYCLRVDPNTGSRMETVQCYTRAEWAQLEVDLDKEWAANGVKTLG
jgi:hypothetical protein